MSRTIRYKTYNQDASAYTYEDILVDGQSTGLFDMEGTEVFEGDVVDLFGFLLVVVWVKDEGKFAFQNHDQPNIVDAFVFNSKTMKDVKVVGKIDPKKEDTEKND